MKVLTPRAAYGHIRHLFSMKSVSFRFGCFVFLLVGHAFGAADESNFLQETSNLVSKVIVNWFQQEPTPLFVRIKLKEVPDVRTASEFFQSQDKSFAREAISQNIKSLGTQKEPVQMASGLGTLVALRRVKTGTKGLLGARATQVESVLDSVTEMREELPGASAARRNEINAQFAKYRYPSLEPMRRNWLASKALGNIDRPVKLENGQWMILSDTGEAMTPLLTSEAAANDFAVRSVVFATSQDLFDLIHGNMPSQLFLTVTERGTSMMSYFTVDKKNGVLKTRSGRIEYLNQLETRESIYDYLRGLFQEKRFFDTVAALSNEYKEELVYFNGRRFIEADSHFAKLPCEVVTHLSQTGLENVLPQMQMQFGNFDVVRDWSTEGRISENVKLGGADIERTFALLENERIPAEVEVSGRAVESGFSILRGARLAGAFVPWAISALLLTQIDHPDFDLERVPPALRPWSFNGLTVPKEFIQAVYSRFREWLDTMRIRNSNSCTSTTIASSCEFTYPVYPGLTSAILHLREEMGEANEPLQVEP